MVLVIICLFFLYLNFLYLCSLLLDVQILCIHVLLAPLSIFVQTGHYLNLCHFPLLPTTHLLHLLRQKPLHLLFLWQLELVFGDEQVVVHASQGVFY